MTMRLALGMVLSAAVGCAPTLSKAGEDVRLMKSDPPQGCDEIGSVSGTGNPGSITTSQGRD